MDPNNKPILKFILAQAIGLALGLLIVGAGVAVLLREQSRSGFGASLVVVGLWFLYCQIKTATKVFGGRSVLNETVVVSLPGQAGCELCVPSKMNKGRVILFFAETWERYFGKISVQRVPGGGACSVAATLRRREPSRMRVPKWLPTSDRGEVLENWPRGTGQSKKPVVLEFPFSVEPGEKLKLDFELESNFKGTKLERRFPITGKERIRIFVKE